jgi:hypothetical protein
MPSPNNVEQNWGTGTGPFLYGTSSGITDGDMGGGGY